MPARTARVMLAATFAAGGMALTSTSTLVGDVVGQLPTFSVAADTFPTFNRVLLLESTSETSANVTPSTIYFNDGSGRRFVTAHFGDKKGTVYGFAIADLDRDGLLDIAVARSDAQNAVYFGGRAKSGSPRESKGVEAIQPSLEARFARSH